MPIVYSNQILVFATICFGCYLLFLLFPRKGSNILLILFLLLCLRELFLITSQLFGFSLSNNNRFLITGSFENPGPCGGFLSICISVSAAFCLYNWNSYKRDNTTRVVWWIVLIISLLAFLLLVPTQSRSALVSLSCSLLLLLISQETTNGIVKRILKRYGFWIIIVCVSIGIGAYAYKKPSADGRFFISKICIQSISSNGLKGTGHGTFGGSYGYTQANYFKKQIEERGKDDLDWGAINEHERLTADCPDNAFNEYLFIGVEYGLLAMFLYLGIVLTAIVISYLKGSIWCYGMVSFSIFAIFSYPLHVELLQIVFLLLLVSCIKSPSNKIVDKRSNSFSKALELAILSIAYGLFLSVYFVKTPERNQYKRAIAEWEDTKYWYTSEYYDLFVNYSDSLLPFLNSNIDFLFAYGQSLNKIGLYEKSDSVLLLGTKVSSDPMFWNVMGNNSMNEGKYREAEQCYKQAFYTVPNRLCPLYLITKLYYVEGDTTRFLDMAERLESFKAKVESRNTERLRSEIRQLKSNCLLEEINNE